MSYEIDLMHPGHKSLTVTCEELPAAYAELKEGNSPSVTWGDISDGGVVIVQVADDYSVVTLGADDTFYWLQTSDDEESVTVEIGGTDAEVPRAAVVPREWGLSCLESRSRMRWIVCAGRLGFGKPSCGNTLRRQPAVRPGPGADQGARTGRAPADPTGRGGRRNDCRPASCQLQDVRRT